jgi:hypothetical protein
MQKKQEEELGATWDDAVTSGELFIDFCLLASSNFQF